MSENQRSKTVITQESLQPKRIEKKEKAYQSVRDIEERLKAGDATNIALTGPYGSGKSSILITLKEDFRNHHYLNISLATLKPSDAILGQGTQSNKGDENEDELSKQNIDRLIEYSILQQLIYKEKQETLPNSRFKRIFHLPSDRVIKVTSAIILAFLAFIVVFEPPCLQIEWLCKLLDNEWLNITSDLLSIGYLLWFAYNSIALIVPAISNSRLNKLNLKDGEIEIVENTSIFNKHLDEILYFFEQTEYDVVLLEDLDRFESTDIFLKLRELNLMLNESKVVGRKIFFIYAVRDDMFKDAERVKCFDYITTVIPVINRSNAKSQLKNELEKRGVTEIKESTLKELGFFLYDMRLLKNIANEYVQYRDKLEKGISGDKLLGMLVYKNYYPSDFADLHDCKGIVYQLFSIKETFAAVKIGELESENKKRREMREIHQKELHLKEGELRRIYVDAYKDRLGATMQHFRIGDSNYSTKDIAANEKLFEKLISNNNIKYTYIDTNGGYYGGQIKHNSTSIAFSDIEKAVNPEKTYRERIDALRATFKEFDNDLLSDIRKEDIRSQTLSQLMNGVDYSSIESYKKMEVPRLIEFLVVKGYIDENYYDYISYFYANFIDAHDWDFVLDLKLGKLHPYDYHIDNVEVCLTEIPNTVYRKNAILNIDLLDYLASHTDNRVYSLRLLVILRTVIEGEKYDFLAEYYKKGKEQDKVFGQLFSQYKGLWNEFDKNDDEKWSLKLSWYKYAEKEHSCEGSRKWLNEHYGFITDHMLDISDEEWSLLVREGEFQFTELNSISNDILKVVADTNSYALTRHNVEILVSCLLGMTLDSVSYRLVNETEHNVLINRVEENLGQCMKTVFAAPESELESEGAIYGILLSTNATDDEKIAYLKNQHKKMDFDYVEQNDVKKLALKCDVIVPSWENVIHYMNNVSTKKLDEELAKYVERHADELSGMKVPSEVKEDELMLHTQLIGSNSLPFDTYKKIITCYSKWYYQKGVPSIEERRIGLLIENGMVHFTDQNTKSLVEGYSSGLLVAYLLRSKREFLAAPGSVIYTTEVAAGLMKSDLSIREKSIIIPYLGKDILNEALADEIVLVLNKQELDLEFVFLLKVLTLTKKAKERLLVLNYTLEKNDFSEDAITALLNTLEYPYKYIAEKGKKPELPDTHEVWQLVKILENKGYISSYSETKKGIRVNTKKK